MYRLTALVHSQDPMPAPPCRLHILVEVADEQDAPALGIASASVWFDEPPNAPWRVEVALTSARHPAGCTVVATVRAADPRLPEAVSPPATGDLVTTDSVTVPPHEASTVYLDLHRVQ